MTPGKGSLSNITAQAGSGTRRILQSTNRPPPYPAFKTRNKFCHSLLAGLPDAILVFDRTGQIFWSNTHAKQLFGYAQNMLRTQPVEALFPDENTESLFNRGSGDTAAPEEKPHFLRLIGRHEDGGRFLAEISASLLDTDYGELLACSIRDITTHPVCKRGEQAVSSGFSIIPEYSFQDIVYRSQ
ncbi:MAG: PAS domain S-box protein, partial [Chromatiales bacterium]|nr:PAS domain S-box protein [Chromatiales bacterium]